MKYLFVFILLLLSSCGKESPVKQVPPAPEVVFEITDEFDRIKNHFDELYKTDSSLIKHEFINIPYYAAYCHKSLNLIQVRKDYWEQLDSIDKEALVFHELGHCVLDRNHVTEINSDGYPVSIMFPVLFSPSQYYRDHYNYYIQELGEKTNEDSGTSTDIKYYSNHILSLLNKERGNKKERKGISRTK